MLERRGRKTKWTEEKVEIICKAISMGKTYKDAYTAARVSERTFYAKLKDDLQFSQAVKKAEAEYQEWYDTHLVSECKRSIVELIQGYTQVTTKTRYYKDKNGQIVEEKTVEEKKLPPSATALIFALCNRDPEHWQNRVSQDVNGKIDVEQKGQGVSLANVPDSLLAQVIDAINGK